MTCGRHWLEWELCADTFAKTAFKGTFRIDFIFEAPGRFRTLALRVSLSYNTFIASVKNLWKTDLSLVMQLKFADIEL